MISFRQAAEPEAVYILDADTGHLENGLDDVLRMFHLLMSEKETAACTCPVRPMSQFGSFLSASQALECEFFSLLLLFEVLRRGKYS